MTKMRGFTLTLILLAAAGFLMPGQGYAQAGSERAFLLVAKPGMLDPVFSESVVLVVRPDEGGPLGVILNRPSTIALRTLLPDRPELATRDDLVFLGGPVEPDALLFAFRSPDRPSKGLFVAGDIYISGFSEVLTEILKHPENANQQRFFSGYSGWATGQLENEIARDGWYVLRFDDGAVFDMNPLTLYEKMLRRATIPRIEASREFHLAGAVPR
jgi:putative transcriptional regulator